MRLIKCLEITKTQNFHVFIYPKGHKKGKRELAESPIAIFDVIRNDKGILPNIPKEKYKRCKVVEIIPNSTSVTILAESK